MKSVTSTQIEAAKSLQAEIARRFDGAIGCSGRTSPGIENGWGLVDETSAKEETVEPIAEGGERASIEQIQLLLDRFKK